MSYATLSLADYVIATQNAAAPLASGWSEAAVRFGEAVKREGGRLVVSEGRVYDLLAAEAGTAFRAAESEARYWADAARASNHEGAARVYERYAEQYYQKANEFLDPLFDKKAAFDSLAREARAAAQDAQKLFGGRLGRVIGPAFDAAQMVAGIYDFIDTGDTDKFGAAAMGVILSTGFGVIAALALAPVAVPALAVGLITGLAAIMGSLAAEWVYGALKESVNDYFLGARNIVIRSDPLVLDLDGDGLELTAASGSTLFDHNADGIKTGTGWARPDDGFLVRDLDNNGTIDTGRELFGVDTIKSNGALATQGFDALKDLDSNNDGFITSADAAFGELKVWQDTNQDGISQSGELKTLTQLNITKIGVNGTTSGTQAGQIISNNLVALSATYTRNGVTRTVGAIDLEANNFFTEFPPEVVDEAGNPVAITTQAQALPQMNGSGMVRNMRAATCQRRGLISIEEKNEYFWRKAA